MFSYIDWHMSMTILVTGASGGMGLSVCQVLADSGLSKARIFGNRKVNFPSVSLQPIYLTAPNWKLLSKPSRKKRVHISRNSNSDTLTAWLLTYTLQMNTTGWICK
jgi:hypothetical protein